jgi:hypothetical protein
MNEYTITREDAEYAFNTLTELVGNIDGAVFTLAEALDSANDRKLDHMMFVHIFRMTISRLLRNSPARSLS